MDRSERRKDRRATRRARPPADRPREKRRSQEPREPVAEVRVGRRGLWILAASVVVIVIGFVALAMGSIVLAPILLVVGYVVGIPCALMSRESPAVTAAGALEPDRGNGTAADPAP